MTTNRKGNVNQDTETPGMDREDNLLRKHDGFAFLDLSKYPRDIRQKLNLFLQENITGHHHSRNYYKLCPNINLVVLFRALIHFAPFMHDRKFKHRFKRALSFSLDRSPISKSSVQLYRLVLKARGRYLRRNPEAPTLGHSPSILTELVDRVQHIQNLGVDPLNPQFQFHERFASLEPSSKEWREKRIDFRKMTHIRNIDAHFKNRDFRNLSPTKAAKTLDNPLLAEKDSTSSAGDLDGSAHDGNGSSEQTIGSPSYHAGLDSNMGQHDEPLLEREEEEVGPQENETSSTVFSKNADSVVDLSASDFDKDDDLADLQGIPHQDMGIQAALSRLGVDRAQAIEGFYFKRTNYYALAVNEAMNSTIIGYREGDEDGSKMRFLNLVILFRALVHFSPFLRSKDFWVQLQQEVLLFYPDLASHPLVAHHIARATVSARTRFRFLHQCSPKLGEAPNLLAELVDRYKEISDGNLDPLGLPSESHRSMDTVVGVVSPLWSQKKNEFLQMQQRAQFASVFLDRSIRVLVVSDFSSQVIQTSEPEATNATKRKRTSAQNTPIPKRRRYAPGVILDDTPRVIVDLTRDSQEEFALVNREGGRLDLLKDEDDVDSKEDKLNPGVLLASSLDGSQVKTPKQSRCASRFEELKAQLQIVEKTQQKSKTKARNMKNAAREMGEKLESVSHEQEQERNERNMVRMRVAQNENKIQGLRNTQDQSLKNVRGEFARAQSTQILDFEKRLENILAAQVSRVEEVGSNLQKAREEYLERQEKFEGGYINEVQTLKKDLQESRKTVEELRAITSGLATKEAILAGQHAEIQRLKIENGALKDSQAQNGRWQVPSGPRVGSNPRQVAHWPSQSGGIYFHNRGSDCSQKRYPTTKR
ncbi:hypothetical protein MKZ38_002246 [Zalerion maritima]|uniref:Uncharacterized protein n=1 Tax=Zalerion maritima TaxID=339359 RepID=A0AAD5RVX6_9PEZI|nr:hypothetical protein MKZ38_002246 [Zalerion maritima]